MESYSDHPRRLLDRTEVVVLSEGRLEAGVAESVPDKIDIEAVVVVVTIVEEPIGEAMPEDVRMDVVRVAATKFAALVVPERPYVGLMRKPLDDVPNRAGRHLVGLS